MLLHPWIHFQAFSYSVWYSSGRSRLRFSVNRVSWWQAPTPEGKRCVWLRFLWAECCQQRGKRSLLRMSNCSRRTSLPSQSPPYTPPLPFPSPWPPLPPEFPWNPQWSGRGMPWDWPDKCTKPRQISRTSCGRPAWHWYWRCRERFRCHIWMTLWGARTWSLCFRGWACPSCQRDRTPWSWRW